MSDEAERERSEVGVSNRLEIGSYLHCSKCLEELPEGESPQEYKNYDVGWTEKGLQVWCVRHDCNVVNIDFEGHTHPANVRVFNRILQPVSYV